MQTPALTKNEPKTQSVAAEEKKSPRVRPLTNVAETEQAYTLELLVPGVSKNAVDVQVERGLLRIVAESTLAVPEGLKARLREFGGVTYERRFTLPEDVNPAAVEAKLTDGVLTVNLPKREEVKPRTIAIS